MPTPAHPDQPGTPGAPTPDPGLLGGLKRFPASGYHSIEAAEAAAGYHILKPSGEYPLANDNTFLVGSPGAGVPLSRSLYRLPAQPTESIEVDVGLASVWRGDSTWTDGERMNVGGKDGWLSTDGTGGLFFAWRCGTRESQTLWCVVLGATSTGRDNFLAFVATLH